MPNRIIATISLEIKNAFSLLLAQLYRPAHGQQNIWNRCAHHTRWLISLARSRHAFSEVPRLVKHNLLKSILLMEVWKWLWGHLTLFNILLFHEQTICLADENFCMKAAFVLKRINLTRVKAHKEMNRLFFL